MEVLIVGAGAMGRWFGGAIKGPVAFADADPIVARDAADVVGGRAVDLGSEERFAVICFAVPITAVESSIATHAGRATRAVLDISGVMDGPVRAMSEHASDRERISMHPLFGPENAPGNIAVVADEPGPVTDSIRDDLVAGGNVLFETTPSEHDSAMVNAQARTHAAILAFALAVEPIPEQFHTPISRRLSKLAAQVTDGKPRVYAEIQSVFDGADDVASAAYRIADADVDEFERIYREARSRR